MSSAQAGRFFTTEPPEGRPSAGSFPSLLLQHVTYLPVLSHCTGHCLLTKAEPHAHPTPSVGDVRWPGGFRHIPGRISPTAASHGHHAQQHCLSLDPHVVGLSYHFPVLADTETPPSWASVRPLLCGPAARSYTAGIPKLWDLMPDDLSGDDVIIIEIKCAMNIMHVNHPQTTTPTPPRSVEKLSLMKPVPVAKKVGVGGVHSFLLLFLSPST